MELRIEKPLVFFDLETTGLDVSRDRIVEISYLKLYPNGDRESKTYRLNPTIPISPASTMLHHISDADVREAPTFAQKAADLQAVFQDCDLAGYNASHFDLPLLVEEFARVNIDFGLARYRMIDVQTIYHKKEPRTLSAAYRFYCHTELNGAHGAAADTEATYEVLKAQLDAYPDLQNDVASLVLFSTQKKTVDPAGRLVYNDKGEEVINFGKYKGRLAEEVLRVDAGYYGWIQKGDFPQATKTAFANVYYKIKNKL